MRTAASERPITGFNNDSVSIRIFWKHINRHRSPNRAAVPDFKFCHAAQALAYAS